MNDFRSRKLLLLIALCACCVWATPSACNPNPPGTTVTYNLGGGANGLTSGGSQATGCEQINNQFTGFTYGGTASAAPTGAAISAQFTGAGEAATDADFTGSISFVNSSGGFSNPTAAFTFVATLDPSDVPANGQWMLTGLNLAISGESLGNANNQLSIDVRFCVNATTCGGGNVNDPNFGMLFESIRSPADVTSACFNGGANPCSAPISGSSSSFGIPLGTGGTSIAFEVVFSANLEAHSTTSISGLDLTFDETAETPEPATFALLGSALALLALARWRRLRTH